MRSDNDISRVVEAATPPAQTPCTTLKTTYAKSGCIKLSPDLAYYILYDHLNPDTATESDDFTFTLLVMISS